MLFSQEATVSAIRSKKCDASVLTAADLVLKAQTTLEFNKLSKLASDIKGKSFYIAGVGYAHAEAVASICIQKRSVSKRVYDTILHYY